MERTFRYTDPAENDLIPNIYSEAAHSPSGLLSLHKG